MIFGLPWTWVASAIVITFLGGFVGGCEHEKKAFDAYKVEVQSAAAAQQRVVDNIDKANKQKAKEVASDYENRISAIRKYYGGVYNRGSGTVSGNTKTPVNVTETPTYDVLAEQCAETTQQLVSLQEFNLRTQ